jgi:YidC/Oxa1 family membrane protein insertase
MQAMQPEIKKVQKEFADDKVKQAEALMALYAKYEISPAGPFVLLLVQIPILIGLYQVFINVFKPEEMSYLYSFVSRPDSLNNIAFGLLDLKITYMMLVLLATLAQFWQGRQAAASSSSQPAFLLWIGPLFTFFILSRLPSAIAIYWTATTLFSIIQQHFITTRQKNNGKVG